LNIKSVGKRNPKIPRNTEVFQQNRSFVPYEKYRILEYLKVLEHFRIVSDLNTIKFFYKSRLEFQSDYELINTKLNSINYANANEATIKRGIISGS
jgi:hypothetical protein